MMAQYHHPAASGMHGFSAHGMGLDAAMLGAAAAAAAAAGVVTKSEPGTSFPLPLQHHHAAPEIDKEKEKQARENHCEIERRRRVKMAAYFNELCVMVPTCNTLQRKVGIFWYFSKYLPYLL